MYRFSCIQNTVYKIKYLKKKRKKQAVGFENCVRCGGREGGRQKQAIVISQFGICCLSFQGPATSPDRSSAMRVPRDMTEASGVSVGKEESGVTPLGEQLTSSHFFPDDPISGVPCVAG